MKRILIALIIVAGCTGGDSTVPHDNSEILHWVQPPTFSDNTPMDIRRDVARWDIYCSAFPEFVDNDIAASVASPDNLAFNLSLLRAHGVEPGELGKFVAVKCIGIDNQESAYSDPIVWEN